MASQVVGKSACYKWPSYIRGYHEYRSVWSPTVGETLRLNTELTNPQDRFAVALIKDSCVVGHFPRIVSHTVSFFLGKDGRVGFCEITEAMVNCATGLGLKIQCLYRFYGRKAYIKGSKTSCCSKELY